MKKLLFIIVIGLLLTGSAFSGNKLPKIKIPAKGSSTEKVKSCFDHKTGQCLICKGTGKVKNPKYSKKRWTEKKLIKCTACDGKGKKTEVSKTKKTQKCIHCRRRFRNYKIKDDKIICPFCKKSFKDSP